MADSILSKEEAEMKFVKLAKKMECLEKQFETYHNGFMKYRKKIIDVTDELELIHKEMCALNKYRYYYP